MNEKNDMRNKLSHTEVAFSKNIYFLNIMGFPVFFPLHNAVPLWLYLNLIRRAFKLLQVFLYLRLKLEFQTR